MAETIQKVTFVTNGSRSFGSTYESHDLIFEFSDDDQPIEGSSSWDSSASDFGGGGGVYKDAAATADEEDEEENGSKLAEAAKAFWDSQEELLLATLRRTSSLESRIRKATKEVLAEMESVGVNCDCRRSVAADCRKCSRKQVCDRLQQAGFNCTICKSKWRSSKEIPSGEHTYLEVEQNSAENGHDHHTVKVIIELNFQSEFTMAKACDEYDRMIGRLPEVYVGKQERLKSLIKILCRASKKCMKEKKMHIAPWRKHKYMQAKWAGKPLNPKQSTPLILSPPGAPAAPLAKASMLTFDLLECSLPSLHQPNNTMIRVL